MRDKFKTLSLCCRCEFIRTTYALCANEFAPTNPPTTYSRVMVPCGWRRTGCARIRRGAGGTGGKGTIMTRKVRHF